MRKRGKKVFLNKRSKGFVFIGLILVAVSFLVLYFDNNIGAVDFDPPEGQVVIGSESLIEFPTSALYSRVVNFRPGDGEVVDLNPPLFSWTYNPSIRDIAYDYTSRSYLFQVDDADDFLTPLINVSTEYNMYSFLGPIFSPGQRYYWRVIYFYRGEITPYFFSDIRSFIVSNSSMVWDRSLLANNSYMNEKASHPHILFNNNNKAQLYNILERNDNFVKYLNLQPYNNDTYVFEQARGWAYKKETANSSLNDSWLFLNEWGIDGTEIPISPISMSDKITSIAFLYQLTQDRKYLILDQNGQNSKLTQAVSNFARWYINMGYWNSDVNEHDYGQVEAMGYAYDWLYDEFTPAQREQVKRAIELYISWVLIGNYQYHGIKVATNYSAWLNYPINYSGDYYVLPASFLKAGHSHSVDNFFIALKPALAIYGESQRAREYVDFALNYLLNKGSPYNYGDGTINSGRGYGAGNTEYIMNAHFFCKMIFPEVPFEKNPILSNGMDWWSRILPPQYTQAHEPWGDGGGGTRYTMATGFARDSALLLQDANLFNHWVEEGKVNPGELMLLNEDQLIASAYYQIPINYSVRNLSKLNILGGWVTECSSYSDTPDCYKGVGYIFQARPSGQVSHATFGDLSYQIWAYGTTITDTGGQYNTYISNVPRSQNTILVDGFQQAFPGYQPAVSYHSRIFAYKKNLNYTYFAADGTNAYPRIPFEANGPDFTPVEYRLSHSTAPLSYLTKVHRHFLFVKNKYFIIFDDLSADQPATFSSLYNVLEETLTYLNSENTSFKYVSNVANLIERNLFYLFPQLIVPDVTIFVSQIFDPANITVNDMNGIDLYENPIRQENTNYLYSDVYPRSHVLWFSNKNPATDWHFMTVIYPQKPGTGAPIIQRLDDYTVNVTDEDGSTIISFNESSSYPVDILVNLSALTPLPVHDPFSGSVCGDGVVNGSEACELGTTDSCVTTSGRAGTKACNSQCTSWGSCISSTPNNAPIAETKTIIAYSNIPQFISLKITDLDGDNMRVSLPSTTSLGGKLTILGDSNATGSGYISVVYDTIDGIGTDTFSYSVSDGDASSIGNIVIHLNESTQSTWKPPIGIPRPEFGIDETYRMYDNPINRNLNLTYIQNSEGGYYTHYVDDSGACIDWIGQNLNSGSIANPRCTIPSNLVEGSVVQISHAVAYSQTISFLHGTRQKPVFIRGLNESNKAVIGGVSIEGIPEYLTGSSLGIDRSEYVIVENLDIGGLGATYTNFSVFRNSDIHYGYSTIGFENGIQGVFYNNKIHDNHPNWDADIVEGTSDPDRGGFKAAYSVKGLWVLDNEIYHVAGGGIGFGDYVNDPGRNEQLQNIFIGRNYIHDVRQSGTGQKQGKNFVYSQNLMHSIKFDDFDRGPGITLQYYANDVWMIFNHFYDLRTGIELQGLAGDNQYIIGNLIHDIHETPESLPYSPYHESSSAGIILRGGNNVNVVGNTIYNSDTGIRGLSVDYKIENNIISQISKTNGNYIFLASPRSWNMNNNLFYNTNEGNPQIIIYGINHSIESLNNSIFANPDFFNANTYNFNLSLSSEAIDSGVVSDVYFTYYQKMGIDISKDISGVARPQGSSWDIGAYEYYDGIPLPSCTSSDWASSLNPESCPSSGIQNKTWTKIGECVGGVQHNSSEIVSCTYSSGGSGGSGNGGNGGGGGGGGGGGSGNTPSNLNNTNGSNGNINFELNESSNLSGEDVSGEDISGEGSSVESKKIVIYSIVVLFALVLIVLGVVFYLRRNNIDNLKKNNISSKVN